MSAVASGQATGRRSDAPSTIAPWWPEDNQDRSVRRFIRFMSSSVRGRLSGSLSAAHVSPPQSSHRGGSNRASLRFFWPFSSWYLMVLASLVWLCLAWGDNPHLVAPQRVGDTQKPVFHPSEPVVTISSLSARGRSRAPRPVAHRTHQGSRRQQYRPTAS